MQNSKTRVGEISGEAREEYRVASDAEVVDNPYRWLVMTTIGVGSLLSSIDTNVVNIALPTIRHQFGTNVASAEWVVAIYLLTTCSFLLTFGRLGDMRGQKPIYNWGFFTFVVSSALCGMAPSIVLLIFFRAVQGIGASMVLSSAPAILTANFPSSRRGRVLGLQVLMVYLGATIGPMLGGWLTDNFSWRAVFYVNVPIGLTALFLSIRYIPHQQRPKSAEKFDIAGAAIFMGAFSILIMALNQGHAHGWTSFYILRMFAAAVALLLGFVWTESRSTSPLLDLSLFRVPAFSLSAASSVCNYSAMFTIAFLMPFYLIQGHGLSSSHAGLLMTVQPVIMLVTAAPSGAISDHVGTRWPAMVGMALMALSMFMLAHLNASTPLMFVGTSIGLAGLGTGIFVAPNNSTMMGSAPPSQRGVASGVMATARYMGMILGVGISGAIFTTFLRDNSQAGFFVGIKVSFLVASAVSCLGCIASAVRD